MTTNEYQEALDWLFVQMPNYQNNGVKAYKPGLDNIKRLCAFFGNPQEALKTIHIGGTNGKGSVSNMLASVLQEQGYKVGLYNSPHLVNFTERIKINGEEADTEFVYRFIQKLKKDLPEEIRPSFFEFTTVMAFQYFKEKNVDYAIIEVGLGGRLDSTNIIHPMISAITNVSLDHTNILGNTVEEIAREKAGIIKAGIPVVSGASDERVKAVFRRKAQEVGTKFIDTAGLKVDLETDLKGIYQQRNLAVVQALVEELRGCGVTISEKALTSGLRHVQQNTHFIGRWSKVGEQPLIICDTAHNFAGLQMVMQQLAMLPQRKHLVLGFVQDKNIDEVIPMLPKNEKFYFVKPKVDRGRNPQDYEALLVEAKLNYQIFNSVEEGFLQAKKNCKPEEMIFVGGSNFVVGDFLKNCLHI